MKNFTLHFILTFCSVFAHLSATVIHAPNLDIVEQYIKDLDENALVIFDVDKTILIPKDRILGPSGEDYLHQCLKKFPNFNDNYEFFFSKIALQAKTMLVDRKILEILKNLKQRNIKVIALTAIPTGRVGLLPNVEQWRYQQLASLGVRLEYSFPKVDSITFTNFEGEKGLPVFNKGILASAGYPKGEVLCAFLKLMELQPSKIVFVDDKRKFINSVEVELDKEHIPHVSFHYTAAIDRVYEVDQHLADFQLSYLVYRGVWLSDEEASERMKEAETIMMRGN